MTKNPDADADLDDADLDDADADPEDVESILEIARRLEQGATR